MGEAGKPMATPPKVFHRTNDRGLIEVVCYHTGRILCVQSTPEELFYTKFERLTRLETPEGPVFIERGINSDLVKEFIKYPKHSGLVGDLICEKITEGMTLTRACKELNVKYSDMVRWKREDEDFKKNLEQALLDSADARHDEAMEAARTRADTKTEIETLKWSAEVQNPEKFGKKTKISGDKNAPISFIIDTGIREPSQEEKEASPVTHAIASGEEKQEELRDPIDIIKEKTEDEYDIIG